MRSTRFLGLLLTRIMSIAGAGVFFIAVAWQLLDRGGGNAEMAGLAIALTAPGLLITLHGGVLIDRYSRKLIGQTTELVRAAVMAALGALSATGPLDDWQLYAATVVVGFGHAITLPCYGAMLPQILSREKIVSANAVWQIATQIGAISASALGGVLVAASGATAGLWVAGGSYLVAALALQAVPTPPVERTGHKPNFRADLVGAARVVIADRRLAWVALFSVLAPTTLWISNVLLPPFAKEQLHTGPAGFGLIEALWGVGAMAGGLIIARVARALDDDRLSLPLTLLGSGVAMLAFAFTWGLHSGAAAATLLGLGLSCAGILFPAFVQTHTSDSHLGRVLSGVQFATSGLQVLFAVVIGVVGGSVSSGMLFAAMAVFLIVAGLALYVILGRYKVDSADEQWMDAPTAVIPAVFVDPWEPRPGFSWFDRPVVARDSDPTRPIVLNGSRK